jgi:hypothetical protein
MGRPINNKHFGNAAGKFKVKMTLADGSIDTGAYVIKQIGSHRYRVSNGIETRNLYLAQTSAKAVSLGDESMTILVQPYGGGATEHAREIRGYLVYTCEGNVYQWRLGFTPTQAGWASIIVI